MEERVATKQSRRKAYYPVRICQNFFISMTRDARDRFASSTPLMNRLTTAVKIAGVVLLIYLAHLTFLALSLPKEVFDALFAETGPYEGMSIVLWVTLGGLLLLSLPLQPRSVLAMAVLSFVFAAREADWHKHFTVMSLTKIKFYLSPDVPVMQKILGGIVFIAVTVALVYLAKRLYNYLVHEGGLRSPLGQLLILPAVLLPLSKILDRIASQIYEIFGVRLPGTMSQLIAAYEEGLEMALPALFIVALLLLRIRRGEIEAQKKPAPAE